VAKSKRPTRGSKIELPLEELARRQGTEQIRAKMRMPKKLGDVMPTLMARRGYARLQSSADLQSAWQQAAGVLAKFSKAGRVQRGSLEVIVGNSTILQELNYAQVKILAELQKLAPDAGVRKLRFRTGKLA
jgi:hypothetical protein